MIVVLSIALLTYSSCSGKEIKTTSDLAEEMKESGDSVVLETTDLQLFGLKGNVKVLKDETGNTFKFTKQGQLDTDNTNIERDSAQQIIKLTANDMTTTYTWNSEGKMEVSNSGGMKNTYRYDDRGLLLSCFTEVDSWEMSIYKYLQFDDSGNWIKRERQYIGLSTGSEEGQDPTYKDIETETRKIEYWDK